MAAFAFAVSAAISVDVANRRSASAGVCAAAVADWGVEGLSGHKIKKGQSGPPALKLVENPDILATLSQEGAQRPKLVVGFAAETHDVVASATAKRERKHVDVIVANDVARPGAGFDVAIVSMDKDFFQLVGDGVRVFNPRDEGTWYDPDGVKEKFGVAPDKVVDVQALAGDSVDNVPGVPGIGVKTAAQLINEYGDLETLLARAPEIKQQKRRENLIEFAEQPRISKRLVTLDDAHEDTLMWIRPGSPQNLSCAIAPTSADCVWEPLRGGESVVTVR